MVNIDTVYQRVLILANKEQRGYITPQEFNLYANQAQMEIFEQYFYDLNQAHRDLGNDTAHADIDDMLEEKMQIFEDSAIGETAIATWGNRADGRKIIPDYVYRVSRIEVGSVDWDILSTKEFRDAREGSYLVEPTKARPIANISGNTIGCANDTSASGTTPTSVYYFRKPNKVSWGYFVLNAKALYDSASSKTQHFELHDSEEAELVYRTLKFAGIGMKRNEIMTAGQGMESLQTQQEKQ